MLCLGFGALISEMGMMPESGGKEVLHLVAETALVVLLFLDAAQIDQRALVRRRIWPARMLLIGLPLAFVLGAVAAWLLLPGWPLAGVSMWVTARSRVAGRLRLR